MTTDAWLKQHGYLREGERSFANVAEGQRFATPDGTLYERVPEGTYPEWPLANARQVKRRELFAHFGPCAPIRD